MKTHKLKTWTEYFQAMRFGIKRFEVRKNDRDFQVGDFLYFEEWLPETKEYTGEKIVVEVAYILHGGQFGIEEGYCVMSIK